MTLTASPAEAARLDNAEALLVRHWSKLLTRHSAEFVLSLIEATVYFDPRIGAVMDPCQGHGCPNLTTADDYCSEGCADQTASLVHEARTRDAYDRGDDVRPGAPLSFAEVGLRERLLGGAS